MTRKKALTEKQKQKVVDTLRSDFVVFAKACLKVVDQSAQVLPFELKEAQKIIHEKIEAYRKKHGNVRAIILKGRQMGCSTYIAARFFHKMMFTPHLKTIILSYEGGSASHLYSMVKNFHHYMPGVLKRGQLKSNRQELKFSNESEYKVKSANSKEVARSLTAQQIHASEVAFWKDGTSIMSSALQSLTEKDTEIIFESTANGHNDFYELWDKAVKGEIRVLPIFVPWYLEPTFQIRSDLELKDLTLEEQGYAKLYNLTVGQMLWRKEKIAWLGEEKFKQEYPITPDEAFISTEKNESFIPMPLILDALRRELTEEEEYLNKNEPYIIGVDPAGEGACHTAIVVRKGSEIVLCKNFNTPDTTKVIDLVIYYINKYKPHRLFFDKVGLGKGIFDALKNIDSKYKSCIIGINGAEKALTRAPVPYLNRRSEMWDNMKRWIEEEAILPKDQELIEQLTCIGYDFSKSGGKLQLTSKKNIKDRKISPDKADALAMTFALGYTPRKKEEEKQEDEHYDFERSLNAQKYGNLAWMR